MAERDASVSGQNSKSSLSESLDTKTPIDNVHGPLAASENPPEPERAFSSAKKLVTSKRNRLGDGIMKATKCLKALWDAGAIHQ